MIVTSKAIYNYMLSPKIENQEIDTAAETHVGSVGLEE
jgi:hypothetical protein